MQYHFLWNANKIENIFGITLVIHVIIVNIYIAIFCFQRCRKKSTAPEIFHYIYNVL